MGQEINPTDWGMTKYLPYISVQKVSMRSGSLRPKYAGPATGGVIEAQVSHRAAGREPVTAQSLRRGSGDMFLPNHIQVQGVGQVILRQYAPLGHEEHAAGDGGAHVGALDRVQGISVVGLGQLAAGGGRCRSHRETWAPARKGVRTSSPSSRVSGGS